MNTMHKTTGLAVAVTTSFALAGLASEGALARGSAGTDAEIRALRAELARTRTETQAQIDALRAELAKTHSETVAESKAAVEKVEAAQQKIDEQHEHLESHMQEHHNLLFLRGGYAALSHDRKQEVFISNSRIADTPGGNIQNGEGGYVGAGFDFRLSDGLYGLTDYADLDGELMFEYKNYGTNYSALVKFLTGLDLKNQVSQFTLTASPKIKFSKLGDFRPWIIPAGLALHVINPPSSGVTYLNPGLMVGLGTEYKIWKDLYAGVDFRYHWTGGEFNYTAKAPNGTTVLNKTVIDGFTTGAYLGFGF